MKKLPKRAAAWALALLLAVLAAISVVLLAWVLWRLLRIISRRRLNPDNE